MRIFSGRSVYIARRARAGSTCPTKPATNSLAGSLVDLGRRADLLDAAVGEDRDAIAHRQRLVLIVGDVDERDPLAQLALDRLQLELHLLAELQVERAERLVEQEHPRAVDECSRERDTLALAARELDRPPALRRPGRRTISSASSARRAALALAARRSPAGRRRRSRTHVHVREQRVVLEDGVDAVARTAAARHVHAMQLTRPASGRSKPAITRSVVVLPDPDGPSIVKNSPARTSSVRSARPPRRRRTPCARSSGERPARPAPAAGAKDRDQARRS